FSWPSFFMWFAALLVLEKINPSSLIGNLLALRMWLSSFDCTHASLYPGRSHVRFAALLAIFRYSSVFLASRIAAAALGCIFLPRNTDDIYSLRLSSQEPMHPLRWRSLNSGSA